MKTLALRRTAAEIVAAALYELYPNIELLGGGETDVGFYYDFQFPHPIQISVVEEKMRQIVRERREIRTLEMVPFSAFELLRSKGLAARAEAVEEGETDLVEIIEIGPFFDLSFGPHLKNSAELAAFKIFLEDGRIYGHCGGSKDELKQFLKKLDSYVDPKKKGEELGFWSKDIWLPKGIVKREEVISFLKRHLFQDAFEISAPFDVDRDEVHKSFNLPKIAEIWTFPSQETHIQISFFERSEEDLISCLHSIGKTLTIMGFDHTRVLNDRVTDFMIEDGLGNLQSVISIKRISKKGSKGVDFIVTLVVEKIISQILERNLMMVELEN